MLSTGGTPGLTRHLAGSSFRGRPEATFMLEGEGSHRERAGVLKFATGDSPRANSTMSTSQVRWLAIAGIIVGTVGVLFFGVLAIMIAVVLFGLSVLGLAANVAAPTPTPRRGWGFTCSACGGELPGMEPGCPRCGGGNVPPNPPSQ